MAIVVESVIDSRCSTSCTPSIYIYIKSVSVYTQQPHTAHCITRSVVAGSRRNFSLLPIRNNKTAAHLHSDAHSSRFPTTHPAGKNASSHDQAASSLMYIYKTSRRKFDRNCLCVCYTCAGRWRAEFKRCAKMRAQLCIMYTATTTLRPRCLAVDWPLNRSPSLPAALHRARSRRARASERWTRSARDARERERARGLWVSGPLFAVSI